MRSYEVNICLIYEIDGVTVNAWVTAGDASSQMEILTFLSDVPDALQRQFVALRNALIAASH